jgi:peptide/nickel transport system permease protein
MRRYPALWGGLAILGPTFLLGVLAPLITPYKSQQAIPKSFLSPPSFNHLFGTDNYGFDVFSRVIWAVRIDLVVAISGTLVSLFLGTVVGLFLGYYSDTAILRGKISEVVLRILDLVQAFPAFVLALALVVALGPSITNIVTVLAFINIPVFARLTRSAVMGIREAPYVESARVSGASDLKVIRDHIIRNAIDPSLINASVVAGLSILLTAGLSFIGAGIRVPVAEWGSMISIGAPYVVTGQWWPSVFPGLALGITVFGFGVLGVGLQRLLDPAHEDALGTSHAYR